MSGAGVLVGILEALLVILLRVSMVQAGFIALEKLGS
jgi:hypothetical protein